MTYLIDTLSVNSRTDWRHQLFPVPASRRLERFPAQAEAFSVVDAALPPHILVVGYIEGDGTTVALAMTDLRAKLTTYHNMQDDSTPHTITLDGDAYANCELIEFGTRGFLDRIQTATNVKIRQAVSFRWRPLR